MTNLRVPAALLALVCLACAGTGSRSGEDEPATPFVGINLQEPDPIGLFLSELDQAMRYWTNLTLTAQTAQSRREARQIESYLSLQTVKRIDELIAQLESGPPRNRQRAATALGFTRDARALSPLLAALHDSDPNVVHNSLLGLALLAQADTPTEPLLALMGEHEDPDTRSQAAYALRSVVAAGAPVEAVVGPTQMALHDSEPGVRSQAALVLGLAIDGGSTQALSDLLYDEVPLVRLAAVESLVLIGQGDGRYRGQAARALVDAWVKSDRAMRRRLHMSMALLAGEDMGEDEDRWVEWSRRLP